MKIKQLSPQTIVDGTYKYRDKENGYKVKIKPTGKEEKAKLTITLDNTIIYQDKKNLCSTRNKTRIKNELKERPIPNKEAEQLAEKIYNTALNHVKFSKKEITKQEKKQETKQKKQKQFNKLEKKDKEEIEELLSQNPNLLYYIRKKMDKHIVSENDTKLLLFLIMLSSRVLKEPLHAQITGESSGGKSYTTNQVWKYLPEQENKVKLTRVTQGWVEYASEDLDWKNGILYVAEGAGVEQAKEVVKMLTSGEKIQLGTTIEEELGDKRKAVSIESGEHTPSFITTTAVPIEDTELKNRLITIGIDETEDQTKKILDYQAKKNQKPWEHTGITEKEIQKIKYMLKELTTGTDYKVIIPYAEQIKKELPNTVTMRRNQKKIFGILKIITWLHQYQRPMFEKNGQWYLIAHPMDLFYTQKILGDSFTKTEANLHQTAETIYKTIQDEKENLPEKFTKNDLKEKTSLGSRYSDKTLWRFLKNLRDMGFINAEKNPEDKRQYRFWISEKRGLDTLQNSNRVFDYSNHYNAYRRHHKKYSTENPKNCWYVFRKEVKCPISGDVLNILYGDNRFSVEYCPSNESSGNGESEEGDSLIEFNRVFKGIDIEIPNSYKKMKKVLEKIKENGQEIQVKELDVDGITPVEQMKIVDKMKEEGILRVPEHGVIKVVKDVLEGGSL